MKTPSLRSKLKPHLWFQAYWVIYLIWFFWLDLTIKNPKYIIHSPIDDLIPFNEWFIFPYCSWFVLLAAVTAMLWWYDTESYDKLCLMMFSGGARTPRSTSARPSTARAPAAWRWPFPRASWQSTARR